MIYERFKQMTAVPLPPTAERNSVSPANWLDWQRQNGTLQDIAVWRTQILTLTGVGEPVRLSAQTVSAEFFPVLGVTPLLGRVLTAEDDPFVPSTPFRDPAVTGNPHLHVQVTRSGGHCAFVERPRDGYDGYWAEREIVRFITSQVAAAARGRA